MLWEFGTSRWALAGVQGPDGSGQQHHGTLCQTCPQGQNSLWLVLEPAEEALPGVLCHITGGGRQCGPRSGGRCLDSLVLHYQDKSREPSAEASSGGLWFMREEGAAMSALCKQSPDPWHPIPIHS